MDTIKEIKLSSNWTKFGLYSISSITLLVTIVFVISLFKADEIHIGLILGPILLVILIGLQVYLFIYTCEAKVVGDKLIIKKMFRPEQSIKFEQIGEVNTLQIKKTKYTFFEFEKEKYVFEKAIIINSKSILSFENKDAQDVLLFLKKNKTYDAHRTIIS